MRTGRKEEIGMRTLGMVSSLAIASLIGLAGCGGGDGGGCGEPISVAGEWSGTLADNNCGNGTFSVTFAQNDCQLAGVWSSNFSIPACDELGTLRGDIDDTSVDVTLSPNGSGCSFDVNGVLSGANQISGNYVPRDNCQVSGGGTFSITRDSAATATPGATSTPGATATPSPSPSPTP